MAAAALPFIMAGIGGLGGLFGNRGSTSKIDQTTDQKQSFDNTSMPQYDPKSQSLRDLLINYYMDQLQSDQDYFGGYTRNGLSNINTASNNASQNMSDILASRGIRGPAGGFAAAMPKVQGQFQSANFLNTIPQLQDQRRQSILQQTGSFLSSLPVGQHQYGSSQGTSHTIGTQTQPGNMLGGALQGLGTMLGGLYGMGAFSNLGKGNSSPTTSWASVPNITYNPTSNGGIWQPAATTPAYNQNWGAANYPYVPAGTEW